MARRTVGHRPHIALRHHAVHVFVGLGAHPDREAGSKQKFQRARLGDDAAAGGDHETLMSAQDLVQRFALGAAECLLAEHVENLAQGGAAAPFDFAVKFDEWNAEPLGQQSAERGFAAAAQSNECNALAARTSSDGAAEALEQQVARFCECGWRQALEELRQQAPYRARARPLRGPVA